MAKATSKTAVPKMGAKKAAMLAEFGIEASNGRKGRTFGPNQIGRDAIAAVAKAVGQKKGRMAIVPQYSKEGEKVAQGSLPTLPKGIAVVTVPLTKAQVAKWAVEWATQNGREAADYRGIVLVK